MIVSANIWFVGVDYVVDCRNLQVLAISFDSDHYSLVDITHPIPFISGKGIQELAGNNSQLRVVSLTSNIGIKSIESNDICFLVEKCPHLEVLELVGVDNICIDGFVPRKPLALKYFNLWRSDNDDTTDTTSSLMDFLGQCPNLQILSYGDCFSTVATHFALENLISKLSQIPLTTVFLTFYRGQEELLIKLCDEIGADVQIEVVWDFSNRSPTRMHHTTSVGKYKFQLGTAVPTYGHPGLSKILGIVEP